MIAWKSVADEFNCKFLYCQINLKEAQNQMLPICTIGSVQISQRFSSV